MRRRQKSSCDANLTASANYAGSYETETAHQSWPARTEKNITLGKGHVLPATEAMPEELVSNAEGWRIKSFLTGGLDGAFV